MASGNICSGCDDAIGDSTYKRLLNGLRRRDVARLLGKRLNSAGGYSNSTVDRWLSGANKVPAGLLEAETFRQRATESLDFLATDPSMVRINIDEAAESIADASRGQG